MLLFLIRGKRNAVSAHYATLKCWKLLGMSAEKSKEEFIRWNVGIEHTCKRDSKPSQSKSIGAPYQYDTIHNATLDNTLHSAHFLFLPPQSHHRPPSQSQSTPLFVPFAKAKLHTLESQRLSALSVVNLEQATRLSVIAPPPLRYCSVPPPPPLPDATVLCCIRIEQKSSNKFCACAARNAAEQRGRERAEEGERERKREKESVRACE